LSRNVGFSEGKLATRLLKELTASSAPEQSPAATAEERRSS